MPLRLPLTFPLIPPSSFYHSIALPSLLATSRRSPSQSAVSRRLKSDIRGHESTVSSCIVHLFICSCFIMHFIARLSNPLSKHLVVEKPVIMHANTHIYTQLYTHTNTHRSPNSSGKALRVRVLVLQYILSRLSLYRRSLRADIFDFNF